MSPFNASIRGTFGVEGRFNGGGAWPPNSAAASYADFSATTTSWTAPAGVWRVNVVAVGGGGGGSYQWSGGGGAGGGLAWADNIRVTPGTTYTVQAGSGGPRIRNTYDNGARGGDSYFISRDVICGFGGGSTYYNSTNGATTNGSYNGYGVWTNGSWAGNPNGYTSLYGQGANDAVGGGFWVNPKYMCNPDTGAFDPITGATKGTMGGGGGGWGAYQGGWTTAGAGAGGYNGKGGQYNSLPDGQYQGFGGAGGSGGTQYSSTYGGVGGGGGVGINGQGTGVGTGNDGGHFGYNPWYGWGGNYGGIGGESTTDAPNSYGCNGENQWSNNWPCGGNNIYGAAYGGGGGGSGTSQGGGRGGDGGLRITWNTSGKSIRTRGNTGN